MQFYIKMCLDPFHPLTHKHFLSAHFDCFPFYHRDVQSIINFIYIFKILQTLAVNLGPCKKCFQLGPATPKAIPA